MLRNNSGVDPLTVHVLLPSGASRPVQCWGFTHHNAARLAASAAANKLYKLSEDPAAPASYQNHTLTRVDAPAPGDGGYYLVSTIQQGEFDAGAYFHRGIGYRYNSNGGQTGALAVVRRDWLMKIKRDDVIECRLMVGGVPCE